MIDAGTHAGFIFWAYLGVGLGLAGMIAWTFADARAVKRRLAELEAARPPR